MRLTLKHLLLFAAMFALPLEAAPRKAKTCVEAAFELLKQMDPLSFANDIDMEPEIIETTVKVVAQNEGDHGGARITLERIGEHWASLKTTVGFDPQGDPRWFITTVGEEVADFFGFKLVDDKTLIVPNQKEFTGALAKINEELVRAKKDPIAITFYETPDEQNTKVVDYTRRFVEERGIPIAPSGNHLLHDLSFHTGAIYIPRELLDYKAAEISYVSDFLNFLASRYPNPSEDVQAALRFYSYLARLKGTVDVDNGTGTITPSLMTFLNPSLAEGNSPDSALKTTFTSFHDSLQSHEAVIRRTISGLKTSWFVDKKKVELHSKAIPVEELLKIFEEFTRDYKSARFPNHDHRKPFATSQARLKVKQERLCREVTERRRQIREAVLRLRERSAKAKPLKQTSPRLPASPQSRAL